MARSFPVTCIRRFLAGALLAVDLGMAACGGGASPAPNPQPTLSSLSPSTGVVGQANVVTVSGAKFVDSSIVEWNGSPRKTSFISSTSLQAEIAAGDLAAAGPQPVTVLTPAPGGGTSNALLFSVLNPAPVISSINPASAGVGGPDFQIAVFGSQFVASSTVQWNGSPRPTTFISSTVLTAQISGFDLITLGAANITVVTPAPGGGISAAVALNIVNPVPQISSMNPLAAQVGSAGVSLTIQGAYFEPSSVILWNGSPRPTTVGFDIIYGQLTAADLATPGPQSVSVFTPTPGGGTSNTLIFNVGQPVPAITSISPAAAVAGGKAFTLNVTGSNFVASSIVQWNGSPRSTSYLSSTSLQAQIAGADIASAGPDIVSVWTPGPGGTLSTAVPFSVSPAPFATTSLSPGYEFAGQPAFVLIVNGAGFTNASSVTWNGVARATTFVSSSQLRTTIAATDIANTGYADVAVSDPSQPGGSTNALMFPIRTPTPAANLVVVPQTANDLVWDQTHGLIYLSVPDYAGATGNTVQALNPTTGTVVNSTFVGSDPERLAIADDDSYLYVGLDAIYRVRRLVLPGLTADIDIPLDRLSSQPYFAIDIQPAPGIARSVAVSLGAQGVSPVAQGGIAIFDDATVRPLAAAGGAQSGGGLFDTLQWGFTPYLLYAADNEVATYNQFEFYTLGVNSDGASLMADVEEPFGGFNFRIHFDRGTGLLYSDKGGVVDPRTATPVGSFTASGLMVPDSGSGAAYFIGQLPAQTGTWNYTLEMFDLTRFTPVYEFTLTGLQAPPTNMIRWGTHGLAIATEGGPVLLVSGTFVGGNALAQLPHGPPITENVHDWHKPPQSRCGKSAAPAIACNAAARPIADGGAGSAPASTLEAR